MTRTVRMSTCASGLVKPRRSGSCALFSRAALLSKFGEQVEGLELPATAKAVLEEELEKLQVSASLRGSGGRGIARLRIGTPVLQVLRAQQLRVQCDNARTLGLAD